jgi:ketosteroid isomerase-like protein
VETIADFLARYDLAFAEGDVADRLALFGSDPVVVGTGVDEVSRGRAALEAILVSERAVSGRYRLDWLWQDTAGAGDTASVIGEAYVLFRDLSPARDPGPMRLRVCLALERQGSRWVIRHSHVSVPSLAQREGSFVPDPAAVRLV